MIELTDNRGHWFYLISCLIAVPFALIFTLGSAFSSLLFASAMLFLVDLPLAVGIIRHRAESPIPSALIVGSSLLVIVFNILVSARNLMSHLALAPMFFLWLPINVNLLFLSFLKIKQLRLRNGATPWLR